MVEGAGMVILPVTFVTLCRNSNSSAASGWVRASLAAA
jgi:hypothetical protein